MTSLQLMMQLVVFSTLALGLVYFLFYKPTIEMQRKARRVIAGLQVGDEVVTTSGFIGRIVQVSEPDDGPAVVGIDLGGVTVRARVTAIAEIVPRADITAPNPAAIDRVDVNEIGTRPARGAPHHAGVVATPPGTHEGGR